MVAVIMSRFLSFKLFYQSCIVPMRVIILCVTSIMTVEVTFSYELCRILGRVLDFTARTSEIEDCQQMILDKPFELSIIAIIVILTLFIWSTFKTLAQVIVLCTENPSMSLS